MGSFAFRLLVVVLLFAFSAPAHAEDAMGKEALQRLIIETLRDNPQVLLDILRNNSEAVLDIAQQGSNLKRTNMLVKQWKSDMRQKKNIRCAGRPVFGNKDAKVRIVAFSDFSCHYCQTSKSVIDSIFKEYSNNVCFIFKSIPNDEKGPSATASLWFLAIANQDEAKAWKFYNTMFEKQETLLAEGESFIKKTAKDLKLNMNKLEKDVRNDKRIKTLLREDRDDAEKFGVEGTPCFFVNNLVIRGALPLEFFRTAVKMALKGGE